MVCFGCFGFDGNSRGVLQSLLCALLALLILSVMLMVEWYFDDVTDLIGTRYFSAISLSIFSLVNGKLILVLSACAFDVPSKSQLLSLQILPFSIFSANLINCSFFELQLNVHFQIQVLKFVATQGIPFFYQIFVLLELLVILLHPYYDLHLLYWKIILKT